MLLAEDVSLPALTTWQTPDAHLMSDRCWASVCDAGPTLIRHKISASLVTDNDPAKCFVHGTEHQRGGEGRGENTPVATVTVTMAAVNLAECSHNHHHQQLRHPLTLKSLRCIGESSYI